MDEHTFAEAAVGEQPADYFRVVRERAFIIAAIVIVAVGLAAAYSIHKTPEYRAMAQVLRQTAALDQTLFGTSVFQIEDPQRELQTGASLVKTTAVAQMVKADLGSKHSTGTLLAMLTVTAESQADIISITAAGPNPSEVANIANSFARQFILYRQETNKSILVAADQKVVAELDQMSPSELASPRGTTLTQKHEELGILESMQTGGFELVQQASTPSSSFTPRPVRNALFALIGGLVLGVLVAFLVDYLDRRIKDDQALEREYGLPVLASVPRVGRRWIHRDNPRSATLIGFTNPQSPYLEAFRTLRSNLRFFQMGKSTQILLVTSGLPQEGKTVTAINLALSLALSGARVILLEADLRRPMLHQYLQLDSRTGVSSVLAGTSSFTEAVQVVRVPDFISPHTQSGGTSMKDASLQKGLICMASGPLPPNPAELLSSQRMRELITTAAAHAEYVLIDTPPLLLVSDALNLAEQADGIIVACRMEKVTVDEAREVRTILQRHGSRALGLVANGVVRKRAGYRERYRGYYSRPNAPS